MDEVKTHLKKELLKYFADTLRDENGNATDYEGNLPDGNAAVITIPIHELTEMVATIVLSTFAEAVHVDEEGNVISSTEMDTKVVPTKH